MIGTKWEKWIVGVGILGYLAIMCLRSYSWTFAGSDGGDWLASAITWMVPQPYGAPLYILWSHLIALLFPNSLPFAMSLLTAALPSAITAVFVYLTLKHLTTSKLIPLTGTLLVAGSLVLLTQSTSIDYHAMAIMFLTIAFYFYTLNKLTLTYLFLGLGTAVHILILPLAFLWFVVDYIYNLKNKKKLGRWIKPIIVYITIVALFYSFILLLMYLPTPKLLAGSFSLTSIIAYWTKTSRAIIGQISIFEAPHRLLLTLELLFASFGLALIPLYKAFKRPLSNSTSILLVTIVFVLWYYITCIDALTWTYLAFATPSIIILACLGLSHLPKLHTYIIMTYAIIILLLNPFFMNANTLTKQNPIGENYLQQLSALPNNSIVVADAGACSLGLFYYINLQPSSHIMPLIYSYLDYPDFYVPDYANYLFSTYHYNLDYSSTLDAVQSALQQNISVYYADYPDTALDRCFTMQGTGEVKQIVALTGLGPIPAVEISK
jgi:hypothetical protein